MEVAARLARQSPPDTILVGRQSGVLETSVEEIPGSFGRVTRNSKSAGIQYSN
jgi:hypothetical protein